MRPARPSRALSAWRGVHQHPDVCSVSPRPLRPTPSRQLVPAGHVAWPIPAPRWAPFVYGLDSSPGSGIHCACAVLLYVGLSIAVCVASRVLLVAAGVSEPSRAPVSPRLEASRANIASREVSLGSELVSVASIGSRACCRGRRLRGNSLHRVDGSGLLRLLHDDAGEFYA